MKKRFLVFAFLLWGCSFSAFSENLLDFYKDTDEYESLVSLSYTTESEIALYRMDSENRAVKIGTIEKGRNIEIIADIDRTQTYDKTVYYLVKTENDKGLWSGWVSREDINIDVDIKSPRYMLNAYNINLTEDNERSAFHVGDTGHNGKWFIVERSGNILYTLEEWEVKESRYDLSYEYVGFEGWSENRNSLWLHCVSVPDIIAFIVIDLIDHHVSIKDVPPHFGSFEYKINYDTQDIYYSDYHYAFDIDTAIMWNREGRIYTLYHYNFDTEELHNVDQNKGEGFSIDLDESGRFQYKRANSYRIGKLNDSLVRIRKEPNLESETIGHLSQGQIVNIFDQTEETMKIGNMDSVWYRIYTEDYKVGWAYGYFIDIQNE